MMWDVKVMALAGVIVLTVSLISLLALVNRRLVAIAAEQRRLHLQQATIVGMLLRAGFRGPSAGRDWGDSGHFTKVR